MKKDTFDPLVYLGLSELNRTRFLNNFKYGQRYKWFANTKGKPLVSISYVATYFCDYYKFDLEELKSGRSHSEHVFIKKMIAYIAYGYGNKHDVISTYLGYSDRSSSNTMVRTFNDHLKLYKDLKEEYLIHQEYFEKIFGKFVQHYR